MSTLAMRRDAAVVFVLWALVACRPQPADQGGVIVEEVLAKGSAMTAGLKAGDRLLSWQVAPPGGSASTLRGTFHDPFEVPELEVEHAPRGQVTLHGRREGKAVDWNMPRGDWKLRLQPLLAADQLARYGAARGPLGEGKPESLGALVALAEQMATEGQGLVAVRLFLRIGEISVDRRLWPEGERAFERARALADTLRLDDGLRRALALAHANAAQVAYFGNGQGPVAERLWKIALPLQERLAPESLQIARTMNGLAGLASARGDAAEAERGYRGVLAIRAREAPQSAELASVLLNVGMVLRRRGRLSAAEAEYRRALDVAKRIDPRAVSVADASERLGLIANALGDWSAAEDYLRQARTIHEEQPQPESRGLVTCLINLGEAYSGQRRFADARAQFERARDVASRVTGAGMLVPYALRNLGLLAGISGDLPQARAHLEAALEAFRRDTPGNPIEGQILYELGALALRQGRLAEAERRQRESREIRRRLAPRTDSEAESLFGLGDVRRSQGRVKEAVALWSEAVAILEAHGAHITDSAQGRLSFSAYHNDVFHELTGLLLETGAPERAFQMLERSRGRALRAMLAERNLAFSAAEVPGELLRRQQQLDGEYDRLLQRQAELRATDQKAVADLLTQLEDLRQNRDLVAKQVREAMPRLGALQHPEPLDLQGALRALDPGTLLLSYSCGSTRSLLFVLAGGVNGKHALRTFVLPVTRDALQDRVEIFRKLLARGQDVAALDAQARRLFDDLLGPARPLVAASRRLLIVPDGPLHALPFAALVDSTGPHYLVELKPLHVAPSLTVYAELMRPRAETARPAGPPLVAFGAPDYGTTAAGAEAALANPSLAARAQRLGPLPASAGEVADIAALYPGAITYVGGQATEEKAKTLPAGTRILHFATHALLDGRRPLDSALVLSRTPNGSENGLFQAWEIFERLRVDADLVTLAACDTGLGRDMGGEGLISLARAFQFAGARSVLASLWAVDDAPTATLMKSFYAGLRHGSTKDEALQAAQLEALRRTPSARSFHWAAFELSGAWN